MCGGQCLFFLVPLHSFTLHPQLLLQPLTVTSLLHHPHSLISFFFFFFGTATFYLHGETPSLPYFPKTSHTLLLSLLRVLPGIPFNLSGSPILFSKFCSQKDSLLYSRSYCVSESIIAWNVDVGNDCCCLFAGKGAALSFTDDGIQGLDFVKSFGSKHGGRIHWINVE